MIRGIAFDLFDTLVDQNHDRLAPVEVEGRRIGATTPALHRYAVDELGMEVPILAFADRLRSVDRKMRVETIDRGLELATHDRFAALAESLGCPDVAAAARGLTQVHMSVLREAVTIPDHHEAVLANLAVDHPLALCSNFSHAETARSILRRAGFDVHLDPVVISEEVGIRKPRREIFEAVSTALALAPGEILHVGDDLRADVGGAAALGMKTVWLTRRVRDPEAELAGYEGPRPDFALEDLMDLPVLIARLNRPR
ncbi:MAG TPA: HAD family hydrolase [Deltaproteobacteria bacterium]|nr:HAD family hydrolase [Deltaproteobacteria bacterium]